MAFALYCFFGCVSLIPHIAKEPCKNVVRIRLVYVWRIHPGDHKKCYIQNKCNIYGIDTI